MTTTTMARARPGLRLGRSLDAHDLAYWIDGLPGCGFALLRSFASGARVTDGESLADEIDDALFLFPPTAAAIERTARRLAAACGSLDGGVRSRQIRSGMTR